MKKFNQKGFVLAETLVVTVFLMVIFAMIYSNYLPLVGEYEKRESYDDVDGKYSAYWIKQMIESASYTIAGTSTSNAYFENKRYVRFECKDLAETDSKAVCKDVVTSLQVNGCDADGNFCDIFITDYQIGNGGSTDGTFKGTVRANATRYLEECPITAGEVNYDAKCKEDFINRCTASKARKNCDEFAVSKVFSDGLSDYVVSLPDYITPSLNRASYRVIIVFHNQRDNNNYYSYATMEIVR